jgi:hypothetical protein
MGKKFETATYNLNGINNEHTFEIVTDRQSGKQILESKVHKLRRHASINNLTPDNFYNQMKAVA